MGSPWVTRIAAALLPALLVLPAARMAVTDARRYEAAFTRRENRKPARFDRQPLTLKGVRDTVREFDAWFTDRFGFRMELIRLKARLYLRAGVSPREDLILLGKDGWLFLGNSHARVIEKSMGRLLFTEPELDAYADALERRSRLLAERGVQYMVFLAPNKHEIYPEHLPAWAVNPTGRTLISQLTERLAGRDVIFEDLKDELLAAKKRSPAALYFKTDSHWNELGAHEGYRHIIRAVRQRFPGARSLEDLAFRPAQEVMSGNAAMLGVPAPGDAALEPVFGDGFRPLKLGGSCGDGGQPVRKGKAGKGKRGRKPRELASWRRPDDGYLAVLPNLCRPRQVAIVNGAGVPAAPRVLVLGDSFMKALSPYLNQSFATTYYTYVSFAMNTAELLWYVEKYRPDLVLQVTVARAVSPGDSRLMEQRPRAPRPPRRAEPRAANVPPARPAARR